MNMVGPEWNLYNLDSAASCPVGNHSAGLIVVIIALRGTITLTEINVSQIGFDRFRYSKKFQKKSNRTP